MDIDQNAQSYASRFNQSLAHSQNNISLPSANRYSLDISFTSNDTAASNLTRTFQGLSLNYSNYLSTPKLKELKTALTEANDAHSKFMISKFVLDCFKASEKLLPPPLARKMRRILSASMLGEYSLLKTGKTINVLGLSNSAMCAAMNVRLTSLEEQELKEHALNILEENVRKLVDQKKSLKGNQA